MLSNHKISFKVIRVTLSLLLGALSLIILLLILQKLYPLITQIKLILCTGVAVIYLPSSWCWSKRVCISCVVSTALFDDKQRSCTIRKLKLGSCESRVDWGLVLSFIASGGHIQAQHASGLCPHYDKEYGGLYNKNYQIKYTVKCINVRGE